MCFSCMNRLETADGICPNCGHDNRVRENDVGFLPCMVLNDRYLVGRALGCGGFGVTYVGYDLQAGHKVAIKEYFPRSISLRGSDGIQVHPFEEQDAEAFERGIENAQREGGTILEIRGVSNVVEVYDVFRENGTSYIIMEYIDGISLSKLVEREGRLDWRQAYMLLRPVMEALHQIHQRGIIHRDVSPDNIMKRRDSGKPVLLDFGAAHSRALGSSGVSFHPGYAAPEQYRTGRQDARVDQYSMCATFYHLITGEQPVASSERAQGGTSLRRPRKLGSDIPAAMENVIFRGMALIADDRFRSMAEMIAVFDAAGGKKAEPKPKPEPEPKRAKQPRQTKQKPAPAPKPAAKPNSGGKIWIAIAAVCCMLGILICMMLMIYTTNQSANSLPEGEGYSITAAPDES